MTHNQKHPAQPRNPFAGRAQHFARTAEGIAAHKRANVAAASSVRELLATAQGAMQ
jgi:ribosomal protein S12 methylthiotransferase accessory factor YcaO